MARLRQREPGLATPHAEPAREIRVAVLTRYLVMEGDQLRPPRCCLAAVARLQRHAGRGPRRDAHRAAPAIDGPTPAIDVVAPPLVRPVCLICTT